MKKVAPILPDWISRQASLGPNLKIAGNSTLSTELWYMLTMKCPLIFEKYAVILHPFWINNKIKQMVEDGTDFPFAAIKNDDFKNISWANFFRNYGKEFDFETALIKKEEIRLELLNPTWPQYIWFPAEGDMEDDALISIKNFIINFYGDVEVNNFYCLLKTVDWESDIVYKGRLSEIDQLRSKNDIRDNPTAIFPDDKAWCVVTDFDLPYTYIGGSKTMIEALIKSENLDIFSIEPKFYELK